MFVFRLNRVPRALLVAVLLAGTYATAATQSKKGSNSSATAAADVSRNLRAITAAGQLSDLRWPNFPDYKPHLVEFYTAAGYAPAWLRDGQPTPQALQMIEIFKQAHLEGLNDEDYDADRWAARLATLNSKPTTADQARFDAAMTVCAMRYVSDTRIGRINPQKLKFGFDVDEKKLELAVFLKDKLVSAPDVKPALEAILPTAAGYARLKTQLARYEELAKQDDGEKLPPPPGLLFPGGPYAGVPRLVKLLTLVGDMPASAPPPSDPTIYDGAVVEGVKKFQMRHGIEPDGALDAETIDAMNVPLSVRVEQIKLSMERFRWFLNKYPQPPVVVNLPEFRLRALNDQMRPALFMLVDVGDQYDHQTPIFEDSITYIVFRPYWDVPSDIIKNEIVPSMEDDPSYLSEFNFEVVTPTGELVSSPPPNATLMAELKAGRLRVRQKPGPNNALGLVKIIFPNSFNVYMHDTPVDEARFSKSRRDQSHGCIHLKRPAEMAAFLLRDKPEWTLQKVQEAMKSGPDNQTVTLTNPVPILLVYGTAVVREDNNIYFFKDIYGHDATLEAALAKGYPYPW